MFWRCRNAHAVKDLPNWSARITRKWRKRLDKFLHFWETENSGVAMWKWLSWHLQQFYIKLKWWEQSHNPLIHSQHHSSIAFNLHSEHSTHWSAAAGPSKQSSLCRWAATLKKRCDCTSTKLPQSFHLHARQETLHCKHLTDNDVNNDQSSKNICFEMWIVFFWMRRTKLCLEKFKTEAGSNWKLWHDTLDIRLAKNKLIRLSHNVWRA